MHNQKSIIWFRRDLRLHDNPALYQAAKIGKILPVFIIDNNISPSRGSASKIYLHHSLISLNKSLNNSLNLYIGNPATIIFELIKKYNITNIFWNSCYEPSIILQDSTLAQILQEHDIDYEICNGSYLWHPKDILKDDGSYLIKC